MSRSTVLLLLSFLSGTAALLYETIWLRWFRVLFGSTAYAASATLCAFFVGLAIGAAIFGGVAGRHRRPLRLYGMIELGAGGAALLVPWIIRAYEPIYASVYGTLLESPGTLVWAKVLLALLGIVPPATLLGGALPALAATFVGDARELGKLGSGLYGTNTLGAAAGTALGALWLPELIGIGGTYAVAVGLSALIGGVALAMAPKQPVGSRPPAAPPDADRRARVNLLGIAFASGMGTLAFEVLMIHALALVMGRTVYSFGGVLLTVLVCLAVAALLVGALPARIRTTRVLPAALGIEALLLLLLPAALFTFTGGLRGEERTNLVDALTMAGLFGGPPLLVGGLIFPLTFRVAREGSAGGRLGGLLAANTLGGVIGSLAASFVLLDWLGLWRSFAVLAAGYAVAAVAVEGTARRRFGRVAVVVGVAFLILRSPLSPIELSVTPVSEGERVLAVVEGADGVISVTEKTYESFGRERFLRVDARFILSGSLFERHQRRLGHIPMLLRGDARHVLFIGSATGETASASLSHPVDRIDLVELVPAVQELAAEYFATVNRGVYTDPRTRRVIEDGRNHVRASPDRYDVIVADLFFPARPGTGSMYSLEHFEAAREHLNPRGIFAQWLPLYQLDVATFEMVVSTFLEVFPDALLFRGDFYAEKPAVAIVGINGPLPDAGDIARAVKRLGTASPPVEDPWVTDPRRFWMLYLGRADSFLRGHSPLNTDWQPRFEFMAARSKAADRKVFVRVKWPALTSAATERSIGEGSPFADVAARWIRAGDALARASRLMLAKPPKISEAVRILREYLPPDMLHGHDITATETWPLNL